MPIQFYGLINIKSVPRLDLKFHLRNTQEVVKETYKKWVFRTLAKVGTQKSQFEYNFRSRFVFKGNGYKDKTKNPHGTTLELRI